MAGLVASLRGAAGFKVLYKFGDNFVRNSLKSLTGSARFRRNVLEIREDLQPDEEWTRKECFSDAGADELLRQR